MEYFFAKNKISGAIEIVGKYGNSFFEMSQVGMYAGEFLEAYEIQGIVPMEGCRSPKPCSAGSSPASPAKSERKLEVVLPWSVIMAEAHACGSLRLEGKFKEADERERALEDFVKNRVDKVNIEC